MPSISGFTVVKDAIKQGYPFVESIASALPVCDEFLVSDGYSSDGTFEILKKIASLNKKVKIFQNEWPRTGLTVIADLSNEMRRKCKSDYLFYLQAPEIMHEDSVATIKALPEIFPQAETFCLPFTGVVSNFKVQEEFRLRFCKNLDRLVLTGDAWTFSTSKDFLKSEALSNIIHPKKLMRYIGRGIDWTYAGTLNNNKSKGVYLPKPIFRYTALFRENFIERCRGHAERLNIPYYYDILKEAEKAQGDSFFEIAASLHRKLIGINYPPSLETVRTEDHPKIMHELIQNKEKKNRYYIRDGILDTIANA
jgi:glycosyltransferase involved in cell wall biosynthesis